MRDERASRRATFRPGLELLLADGQVWSFPVPGEATGVLGSSPTTWDDPSYRAILRAMKDAEDQGERFRAELALAIHLIQWNYAVEGDALGKLFDDRVGGPGVDIAARLRDLASAHVGPAERRAEDGRRPAFRLGTGEVFHLINDMASTILGRRATARRKGRPT